MSTVAEVAAGARRPAARAAGARRRGAQRRRRARRRVARRRARATRRQRHRIRARPGRGGARTRDAGHRRHRPRDLDGNRRRRVWCSRCAGATTRATRWPPRPPRSAPARRLRPLPAACRRSGRSRAGSRHCAPRTARRSSTTHTTPIRIRCARRSTCWPRRPRRAGWCWATWAKWARAGRDSIARSATTPALRGIERLLTAGPLAAEAAAAFGAGGTHFDSVEALARDVARTAPADATLLVKGSRFMRMERVVNALAGKRTDAEGAH